MKEDLKEVTEVVETNATLSCTESDNSTAATADISATTTTSVTFGLSTGLAAATIWYNCQRPIRN